MDQFDKNELHLKELQRNLINVPEWEKAEKMEYAVPQIMIWKRTSRNSICRKSIFAKITDKLFSICRAKEGQVN